ncbi:hypothetical protein JTE90_013634 [Oedothorax gibbosus]|uniref:Uncharacterized protein n=1 Tax=Oedothorax gibbosus TaxID=931172 RepID=A0AAV6TF08_9ARAC|nr:hypothetical protein JTE90_013634 [Oedothorax gibbosus]
MEPSPHRQSSRLSLEYLLLPPRSAPVVGSSGLTPGPFTHATATLLLTARKPPRGKRCRGRPAIVRLSYSNNTFHGSHERLASGTPQPGVLVHPTRQFCLTNKLAHWALSLSRPAFSHARRTSHPILKLRRG